VQVLTQSDTATSPTCISTLSTSDTRHILSLVQKGKFRPPSAEGARLDLSVDYNLILTIWTGSAIPVISTVLGYWLVKRSESRKVLREEKKRVYGSFSQAIRAATQTLADLRAVQLIKIPDPADEEVLVAAGAQIFALQSVWINDNIIDYVVETMMNESDEFEEDGGLKIVPKEGEEVEEEEKDDAEGLEILKNLVVVELIHTISKQGTTLSRYIEEMNRFVLSQEVKDKVARVLQLFQEHWQSVGTSSLLQAAGLGGLDKGADVQPWVKDMETALGDLSKALNEDLKSLS